jgi:NADH-quinone oxidoreductase subunit L
MIGRNAALFAHAPQTLAVIAVIGTATALMAGTIALVQTDIKRVLAYSTVSQLGYMFLAMGVGAYAGGIFHLYTHAFFKALLFLGAGAVIHALGGEQDLGRMGGLKRELPVTYWTFVVGAIAIAGVPGLAGFFSKDEILFRAFAGGHLVLWSIGLATSLLTALYMFRVVFLAFHGQPRGAGSEPPASSPEPPVPSTARHLHDAPPAMALALIVLAAGSVLAGYAGLPPVLGGGDWFARFLEPSFGVDAASASGPELTLMAASSGVAIAGIGIAAYFFLRNPAASDAAATRFAGLRRLLLNKYYVDEIYDAMIVEPIRIVSEEGLWKIVDARVIDGAVNGTGRLVAGGSERLRRVQTGSVRAYAASILLGVVAVLGYYLLR